MYLTRYRTNLPPPPPSPFTPLTTIKAHPLIHPLLLFFLYCHPVPLLSHHITVMVAALGAAGGLLVAATLKYADSIMKTLAAAGAIILSTVLG